ENAAVTAPAGMAPAGYARSCSNQASKPSRSPRLVSSLASPIVVADRSSRKRSWIDRTFLGPRFDDAASRPVTGVLRCTERTTTVRSEASAIALAIHVSHLRVIIDPPCWEWGL